MMKSAHTLATWEEQDATLYLPSGLGVRLIEPFICIKIGAFITLKWISLAAMVGLLEIR